MAKPEPGRGALARRYDGPCPPVAAAEADGDEPWAAQIRHRRAQSWRTVRRAGRDGLAARRAFRAAPSVEAYRIWRLHRRLLSHALTGWAAFRDLARAADTVTTEDRSARSPSSP